MTDTNPHASAVPTEMIEKEFDMLRHRTAVSRVVGGAVVEFARAINGDKNLNELLELVEDATAAVLSATGVPALLEENRQLRWFLKKIATGTGDDPDWAIEQAKQALITQPAVSDAEGV